MKTRGDLVANSKRMNLKFRNIIIEIFAFH